jgi:hypothetical protein
VGIRGDIMKRCLVLMLLLLLILGAAYAQGQTCTDSDGGMDYLNKGMCSYEREDYEDYCVSASQLVEYRCFYCPPPTCENTLEYCMSSTHTCAAGYICADGACREGGCYDTGRACTDLQGVHLHSCDDNGDLVEYSCVNSTCTASVQTCGEGYVCLLGGCIEAQDACVRENPRVILVPEEQSAMPNETRVYAGTVRNKDNEYCEDVTLDLVFAVPENFTAHLDRYEVTLGPGDSAGFVLYVASPPGAAPGLYEIYAGAKDSVVAEWGGASYIVMGEEEEQPEEPESEEEPEQPQLPRLIAISPTDGSVTEFPKQQITLVFSNDVGAEDFTAKLDGWPLDMDETAPGIFTHETDVMASGDHILEVQYAGKTNFSIFTVAGPPGTSQQPSAEQRQTQQQEEKQQPSLGMDFMSLAVVIVLALIAFAVLWKLRGRV